MKFKHFCFLLTLLLPCSAISQPWTFSAPVVISASKTNVYHHLESAGRRNVAATSHSTAIVWEDDRTGVPSIYLALKEKSEEQFLTQVKISNQGDSYEPSITALNHHDYAISWEEDGHVWLRVINAEKTNLPIMSKAFKVSTNSSMYSSLTFKNDILFLTFSEKQSPFLQIKLMTFKIKDQDIIPMSQCIIDKEPVIADQLYPAIVALKNMQVVAWEDRRPGHTIIMASESNNNCDFTPPVRVSQCPGNQNLPYGKGHGVSRVAITDFGNSNIMAAWADKRDFREGYDIYSALYLTSSRWENNQRVQDDFGGLARQWHTTLAGHPEGYLAASWTDDREGTTDIFFSWYKDGEWSDDLALPGASGQNEQSHPSITFDDSGNVHIAWITREKVGGPTELYYMMGQFYATKQ